jgi:hypothetical protein
MRLYFRDSGESAGAAAAMSAELIKKDYRIPEG